MEKTFKQNAAVEAREIEKKQARKKIIVFILAFYLCWLINVIDGFILIIVHLVSPGTLSPTPSFIYNPIYIYVIWITEALFNPLQGLFNALAYGNTFHCLKNGWTSTKNKCRDLRFKGTVTSWSGEYIDVDFRKGRGKILTNHQFKKALSC
jgi:hypothetical protein